jgi:hypothetical protein
MDAEFCLVLSCCNQAQASRILVDASYLVRYFLVHQKRGGDLP